jgi:hypothetical protein
MALSQSQPSNMKKIHWNVKTPKEYLHAVNKHIDRRDFKHFVLYTTQCYDNEFLRQYKMSVNSFPDSDTSNLRAGLRCCFEIQTTWQINYTSFNLALHWSQLCILPARQSYIRQYDNIGPHRLQILQELKPTDKVKRFDLCCNFLENWLMMTLLWTISSSVMRWRSICLIWQPFLSFSGVLWRKMCRSARCRQHRTISKHGSDRPVQTLIRKFSTTCGRRLNIGLMLL